MRQGLVKRLGRGWRLGLGAGLEAGGGARGWGRGQRLWRYVPLRDVQAGVLSVEAVDEVRVLFAHVGEAGVVGGRVGGERPVVDVGHCSGVRGQRSGVIA